MEASSKEEVLAAVGTAAVEIRRNLGESLASIEKYDAPVEQATTSSLEALKAFSRGEKLRASGQEDEAIPLFQRAVELDPDFAHAHGALGTIYGNLREWEASREYLSRAFELRHQVSEREELYITAHYHDNVTGDVDKQIGRPVTCLEAGAQHVQRCQLSGHESRRYVCSRRAIAVSLSRMNRVGD